MKKNKFRFFLFTSLLVSLFKNGMCTRKCLISITFTLAKDIGGSTCTFEDSERVLT